MSWAHYSFGIATAVTMESEGPRSAGVDETAYKRLKRRRFGRTPGGEPVELYTLSNGQGVTMDVTNYGGIIRSLRVPDRHGRAEDVVLGFDSIEEYTSEAYRAANPRFGALVGRYANRIAGGTFTLDETTHTLAVNHGGNHLHGGAQGFDQVVWQAEPVAREGRVGLILRHSSPAGHEGYPGRLDVAVTYWLTAASALIVDYRATTTAPTPVNLTQHTYFHLGGHGHGTVCDHELKVAADRFTPVDAALIPTGELRSVAGTPFDFRSLIPMGRRMQAAGTQIERAGGYDHNFVLAEAAADTPRLAARVHHPQSGRLLSIYTTEPGLQVYSGNFQGDAFCGKGRCYPRHGGLALEPQHFPDSPNQPHFPSTIVRPGQEYASRTVYQFSVRSD